MDDWNQVVAKYESGNWEAFRMHFADTAKINTNNTNSVSPDKLVAQHKETLAIYSTYGLVEEEGDVEINGSNLRRGDLGKFLGHLEKCHDGKWKRVYLTPTRNFAVY